MYGGLVQKRAEVSVRLRRGWRIPTGFAWETDTRHGRTNLGGVLTAPTARKRSGRRVPVSSGLWGCGEPRRAYQDVEVGDAFDEDFDRYVEENRISEEDYQLRSPNRRDGCAVSSSPLARRRVGLARLLSM